MAIYTKKGDRGETSIYKKNAGKNIRLSKSDILIEAIGSVDEANSYLGIVNSLFKTQILEMKTKTGYLILKKRIEGVQRNLFTIGSTLAGAEVELKELRAEELEKEIDKMEKELPKLTNFILPGGSVISAHLMYARTLVRRAERRTVALTRNSSFIIHNSVLKYLNRLSDYLFVLARYENFREGIKDNLWINPKV